VFLTGDLTLGPVNTSAHAATPIPRSGRKEALGRSVFTGTRWSVVLAAGGADTAQAHDALATLCQTYWHPLYAYVRRVGHSREEAEDLTQEFFTRLLTQNTFAKAAPERGRFRSFLLASFKHFLAHEWEKDHARKRGGGTKLLSLEFDTVEIGDSQPVAPGDTPDRAFDRQWALALLDVVLEQLRTEYSGAGRDDLFLGLKETLIGGRSEIPYRDLAGRLGLSEGAVKVAAHRLRRRYRELLRREIGNTVSGPDAVEEELRQLFAALSG
jgi:RNA polymerase sigma factor (sigma-70 family)